MRILLYILLLMPFVLTAQSTGTFHVDGIRLLDANGNDFVMRGVNYSWCWQKHKEVTVIPSAARIGCNAIRIQLGTGRRFSRPTRSELKKLITLCEENHLIAVFNTHDATGSDNITDLEEAARFWIEMKDLLNEHTATTIVNIANEWYGSSNNSQVWADGYRSAISLMRESGILNTLIVDAAGWGQSPRSIFEAADKVADADPLRNTIFSIHMYDVAGKNAVTIKSNIDKALATGYPVIIGEFASSHGGRIVDWQTILDYTAETAVGYLVWSWTGNSGGVEDCDMFRGYDDSEYLPNGTNTVLGRNGIKQTSRICSVYTQEASVAPAVTAKQFDFTKPYIIYDITGRNIPEMSVPGIYILRQDNLTLKFRKL